MSTFSTLPSFLLYLAGGLACLGVFVTVYIRLTPFAEFKLIREGNIAAATAFTGALLGYALPLSSAIAHSVTARDMVVWALIGLVVQYLAHLLARQLLPNLNQEIHKNNAAMGLLSGGLSVVFGMINAACMVY
jgi:putative membrane protein